MCTYVCVTITVFCHHGLSCTVPFPTVGTLLPPAGALRVCSNDLRLGLQMYLPFCICFSLSLLLFGAVSVHFLMMFDYFLVFFLPTSLFFLVFLPPALWSNSCLLLAPPLPSSLAWVLSSVKFLACCACYPLFYYRLREELIMKLPALLCTWRYSRPFKHVELKLLFTISVVRGPSAFLYRKVFVVSDYLPNETIE